MKKISVLFLTLALFFHLGLRAQNQSVIKGKIIDSETKDPLPAYVQIKGTEIGCAVEYDGTFILEIPADWNRKTVPLVVFMIGFKKKEIQAVPGEILTIKLDLEPLRAGEVVVTADSLLSDEKQLKTVTLRKMDVYSLPGTAADPLYASHVLPGVNSLPDSSSLLIRGGAPQEVGYYFDGIEIKHPFISESLHEGYFSIFDNQIIDGFSVSTSGFNAKFGDALSGIMNIKAKDKIIKEEGGIGLSILGLNSYIGLPLQDWGSFIASYNRGHSALMTKINRLGESEFQTEDMFSKFVFKLNSSNQVRLMYLFNNYNYDQENEYNVGSRNAIWGAGLTSTLSSNMVSSLTFSGVYHRSFFEEFSSFKKEIKDKIFQARWDISLDLESHYFEFGADIQNRFMNVYGQAEENSSFSVKSRGLRIGFYLSDKFRLSRKIFLIFGGRLNYLDIPGSGVHFNPRVSMAYLITQQNILRFSTGIHRQFGDYFLLEESNLKPKKAAHISLTYDRITEAYDMRFTLYNKDYRKLFLYESETILTNAGFGYARGVEFYFKRKSSNYDALFVYNYLNSKRKQGLTDVLSASPYDITHSLTAILTWKFKDVNLGIRYSYATGLPYTPLIYTQMYPTENNLIPIWGDPFSRRYPSYQRLDLNANFNFIIFKKMVVLYLGLTNILNRNNVLRYEYSPDYTESSTTSSIFGRSIFFGLYIPFF